MSVVVDSQHNAAKVQPKQASLAPHLDSGNGQGLVPTIAGGNRIIDIRRDREQQSLRKAIIDGLNVASDVEKRLPTLLLYDEAGLKLFEEITYLDEYYLTGAEIDVLEAHADEIARALQPGSVLLELGSGNLRKVNILLRAIDRLGKHVDYYALDLSLSELERTLAEVPEGTYRSVKCNGLHGTYEDGLEWLKSAEIQAKTKTILWLGSSIGNLSRKDAAEFLHSFSAVLQPADAMLIGIDGCKDAEKVYHAYNDSEGTTHRFYANGLMNANRILGQDVFSVDNWDILGEYNAEVGCHEAFLSPKQDISIGEVVILRGEKVRLEEAYKYDAGDLTTLWTNAGVAEVINWTNGNSNHALHLIMKNEFALPHNPEIYASQPVPTYQEWTNLWSLWDAVTRNMLRDEELLEKPIKLRNACIFYLGHIPTFVDMKLTDATDGIPTPPDNYPKIFERGIDPDVDNPEQCHAHSEIPDEWPPLDDILAFQVRVRERVRRLYDSGEAQNPKAGRTLWLGYEHEAMHLETFLYMLLQSDKTLPPPNVPLPNFELEAQKAKIKSVQNEWITVPEKDMVVGLDDPETLAGPERHFGWDIEKPPRTVHVKSFNAQARPITNGEYAEYLASTRKTKVPASWAEKKAEMNGFTNGHYVATNGVQEANPFLATHHVRTVYGLVPLKYALSWPVSASYDELNGYAAWVGGRIPTLEEARSIYDHVDQSRKDPAQNAMGAKIPAVNGHLVNNGVEETPPSSRSVTDAAKGSINNGATTNGEKNNEKDGEKNAHNRLGPNGLYVDLHGCNVGFNNWHPMPVTQNGGRLSGQGDMGGLWEWTSTPLFRHEGYSEMPLYPAYSSDFFDEKHNIVLGGSWATVPRIAGRKSFINWYQRNYAYAWAGARVVKDID